MSKELEKKTGVLDECKQRGLDGLPVAHTQVVDHPLTKSSHGKLLSREKVRLVTNIMLCSKELSTSKEVKQMAGKNDG